MKEPEKIGMDFGWGWSRGRIGRGEARIEDVRISIRRYVACGDFFEFRRKEEGRKSGGRTSTRDMNRGAAQKESASRTEGRWGGRVSSGRKERTGHWRGG